MKSGNPLCPNCKGNDTEHLFSVKNAPVQSLVTIKDYEEAMKIPRRNIDLAFCNECGFIYNSSFDHSIDHYTQGYEDQQGFSPTFTDFITRVTRAFLDKYHIYNKHVVEIGSGKGDFLKLIANLGQNTGTGIDPAWVPGRITADNVQFIREFYAEKHGDFDADCICCRHTMEHIHNTDDFLKTVRKSIKEDKRVVLFFEVPSIVRILKIKAFWDIFYEHCSYFSPGSLARLFRRNRFEILDMYLAYSDQYLFIEAIPVKDVSSKIHPLEEKITDLKKLAHNFASNVNGFLEDWRNKLIQYKVDGKKVVIWGGGSKCVGFLTHFHEIDLIAHVVDINPFLTGNFIPGMGISYKTPEFLSQYKPDVVIVMNGVYEKEIKKSLNKMGINPDLVCLA